MKQKIEPISAGERQWIEKSIEGAGMMVDSYSPQDAGQPLSLAALDRAWSAWLGTKCADHDEINMMINVVGVAFGQILVNSLEMQWMIASDAAGTELAAYGLPGHGDILIYPQNFVAKRFERGEVNFLESSYHHIAEQINTVAQSQRESSSTNKAWWKFW